MTLTDATSEELAQVETLKNMGFDERTSLWALRNSTSMERAVNLLFSQADGDPMAVAPASQVSSQPHVPPSSPSRTHATNSATAGTQANPIALEDADIKAAIEMSLTSEQNTNASAATTAAPVAPTGSLDMLGSAAADAELSRAIEASLKETQGEGGVLSAFEARNPHERKREPGIPVGLKNVGNTCYVNSFLQTYFSIPVVRKAIVSCSLPLETITDQAHSQAANDTVSLDKHRIALVDSLRRLFSLLEMSERKYVDPSPVLKTIVDDKGSPVQVGEQQDASEFNSVFLQQLEDGLRLAQTYMRPRGLDDKDKPKTIINELMYGCAEEEITYRDSDGLEKTTTKTQDIMHMILQVNAGELYEGIEQCTCNDIERFVTDQGYATTAQSQQWLTRPPPVLMFQLQRVEFDAKENQAKKIHSRFDFEKRIFLDRYLQVNKEESKRRKVQVHKLKEHKADIDRQIEEMKNFKNSKIGIDTLLDGASRYVQDGFTSGSSDYSQDELNVVASFLRKEHQKVSARISELTAESEVLQKACTDLYRDMSRVGYRLHSVLIHSGVAGSGHYWVYVHVPEKDEWIRFNDGNVAKVSEEEVWKDSKGGDGFTSAYCLIYVAEHPPELSVNFVDYRCVESGSTHYMAVVDDNVNFKREIERWDEDERDRRVREAVSVIERKVKDAEERFGSKVLKISGDWESQLRDERLDCKDAFAAGAFSRPGDNQRLVMQASFYQYYMNEHEEELMQAVKTKLTQEEQFLVVKELQKNLGLASLAASSVRDDLMDNYDRVLKVITCAIYAAELMLKLRFDESLAVLVRAIEDDHQNPPYLNRILLLRMMVRVNLLRLTNVAELQLNEGRYAMFARTGLMVATIMQSILPEDDPIREELAGKWVTGLLSDAQALENNPSQEDFIRVTSLFISPAKQWYLLDPAEKPFDTATLSIPHYSEDEQNNLYVDRMIRFRKEFQNELLELGIAIIDDVATTTGIIDTDAHMSDPYPMVK